MPEYKKDPKPVLKVLDILKNDESLYVRKSVANNLNDISKDNPEIALKIAAKWYGKNSNTNRIVKHGLRSLLKKGNREALKLFGFNGSKGISIGELKLNSPKVKHGGKLEFTFSVKPIKPVNENIRLEYTIDFITSTGKVSRKIFKITEGKFEEGKTFTFSKKHAFRDLTIRKHFRGKHKIAVIINGEKVKEKIFEVV